MNVKTIVIYALPVGLVLAGLVIWLLVRRTVRTRLRLARELRADPQVNDWLIVFAWSKKVLYVPTILAALAAAGLMALSEAGVLPLGDAGRRVVGGAWVGVFFLNFMVEEFEVNVKLLLLLLLAAAVLALWLALMDSLVPFLRLFRHLGVSVNSTGYLLLSGIFLLAVAVSWLRGLFYYAAFTPNYLNIQNGPSESGEQVSRENFSTRIDTGDFLERLLGFGQIIVTFSDTRRSPLVLLVGHIEKRARQIESIRSHLAVEQVAGGKDEGA